MRVEVIDEARRQVEICNACRYCEGYCAVFPAITRDREFAPGYIEQLANLCHNCRGCHYACQFTDPHEYAINLPKAFAEVRQDSWQEHAVPSGFAGAFHRSGVAISLVVIVAFAVLFWAAKAIGSAGGEGFYAVLAHNAMVAIFMPAFVLPIVAIVISIRRYWKQVGGEPVRWVHLKHAFGQAGRMKNLAGGHGEGCNFEDEDRFSNARRHYHQTTMYGFLLCFASTSVATIMHYVFDMPAPYGLFSLPKILGLVGGLMLCFGTFGLMKLKLQADKTLADESVWGGEMAFVVLLFLVSATGLLLYFVGSTAAMPAMLVIHLGTVLAFFLLMPYSKMVHGFYRLAALVRDAQSVV